MTADRGTAVRLDPVSHRLGGAPGEHHGGCQNKEGEGREGYRFVVTGESATPTTGRQRADPFPYRSPSGECVRSRLPLQAG